MTACYLLETYVSFFFCQNHRPSIILEGKLRSAKFQKSLDAVISLPSKYLVISHPRMESLKGNQFGVCPCFVGQLFQS